MFRKYHKQMLAVLLALLLSSCASVLVEFSVDNPPELLPLKPSTRVTQIRGHPIIGLALGGGATRGFAHIGVLNVLQHNGIEPDIITGTSAGAVSGVLYAGGIRGKNLEEVARQLHRDQVVDWSYSGRGFIRGELLQQYINRLLDYRDIEQLPTVFAATSTDLENGNLAIFTKGNAGLAVRASSTIPGLVSPVTINGRDYVDGGLVSKVPVSIAKQLGAKIIIAVDVSRTLDEHPDLDTTIGVMQQSMTIMSQAILTQDLKDADVIIRPELGYIPLGDFDNKDAVIKAGEQAAEAALPAIRQLLKHNWNSNQ